MTNSLLPPNATPQERAIEAATARIADVPVRVRDVWSPDTCPVELLPWLAWALSIDGWRPTWPEYIKRARIRAALSVARQKGTVDSVRQVVASFGGAIVLREWWQNEPKTTPHTFELTLTIAGAGGVAPTAEFVDDVIAEVGRTKPLRSHFSFTQGLVASGGVGVIAGARVAVYRRLQFDA